MAKDVKAQVLYNTQLSKNYFRLGLKTGWQKFIPGQFVMIRVPDENVLIRRPFSISRGAEFGGGVEIVYKVVGRGTGSLKKLVECESVSLLGPLGRGFDVPKFVKKIAVVAGGFGIAPFMGMLSGLKKRATIYYGGCGMEDVLFLEEFEEHGIKVHVSTDDGTLGYKGLVTEILLKDIDNYLKDSVILCCGPNGLLEAVAEIAKGKNIPAQLSYEAYMGCGIGVCLGCAVKTRDGYKRACKEGPVFDVEEI